MITVTKQENGVLFEFEDSKKYLYGNGSILVPFNTLSIVADESDMITLKKAASNDVFISARYDTDFGYRSKDDAVEDLKDLLFAETGGGSESGVTSGEVQTMIDESISGKADTSDVTAVANDVQTVSGQVATKLATSDFNAYSAATATALSGKQDKLVYYSENTEDGYADMIVTTDDGDGNTTEQRVSIGVGLEIGNYQEYNDGQGNTGYTSTNIQLANPEINIYAESEDNGETESTYFNITPTSVTINGDNVLTDGMITTAITSGSTDSEIPTAKAVYDAIPTGGTGGMDDDMEKLISSSLNDLNDRKIDASEVMTKYQRKGDYATNTALALKANSADVMTLTKSEENEFVAASALVDLNNKFGGLSLVKITESDYAALTTKDDNTLYIVVADPT